MEITLERNVTVQSYEALMEIASFDEKYDFILPVLQLEEEGGITVEHVNTKLLNERPDHQMGERLLDRIEQFRLISQDREKNTINSSENISAYNLTERGRTLVQLLNNGQLSEIDADLQHQLRRAGLLEYHFLSRGMNLTVTGEKFVNNSWPCTPDSDSERSIFDFLETNGFVERDRVLKGNYWTLTKLGEKALIEGKVPVPEKGLFVLYTTDDPLFSEEVIACEPKHEKKGKQFQELAFSKQNGNTMSNNGTKMTDTPRWLKDLIKSLKSSPRIIELPAQNGEEIQLVNVDGQVNRSSQTKSVSLVIRISSAHTPEMEVIASSGKNNSKSFCMPNMEMTMIDVLKQLIPEHADDIILSEQQPALLIDFDEIESSLSEIRSGKRDLTIQKPKIEGYGQFNDLTIKGVPILPRTLDDAIAWADSLVSGWIDYYIDESSYYNICEKAVTRFSGRFDADEIRNGIQSFGDLKKTLNAEKEQNPQKYWFVTTPEVLAFRGVR